MYIASLWMVIYLVLFGLGVYGFILFIKLAHKGIRALDIYIDKNSNEPK